MTNRQGILNTLRELIKIPSVTDDASNRKKIVRYVEGFFSSPKFKIRKFSKNGFDTLIVSNKKTSKYKVLLLGHLDVVPGPRSVFTPRISKGKLHGRGAADMKGSVAAMMHVFKDVLVNLKYPIALVLTTDEETSGVNGAKEAAKILKSEVILVPDGGSSLQKISNATRGIYQLKITAKTAGGSTTAGTSATDLVLSFYNEFKTGVEKLKRQDFVSLNLGQIQGGEAINQAAQNAEIYIDIRFTKQAIGRWIMKLVKTLSKKYQIKLEIIGSCQPLRTDPKNRYLKLYKKTVEQVSKKPAEFYRQNGSHDGRYFANRCSVIATRPLSGGMHADNEWVSIDSVAELYDIYKEFLIKLNTVDNWR